MLSNFFKTAIRHLDRNKGFSLINILGLAVGMASALLILLWVNNELNIDRSYPKADRLYLLFNRDTINNKLWAWNQTPKGIATVLKKDYPAVEDACRYNNVRFVVAAGDKLFNSQGAFADSGFLSMFGFPMAEGDRARALSSMNNIVVTASLAKRLFGDQDPMGRVVRVDNNADLIVTGVLQDLPPTTSFHFDYLIPWTYLVHLGWDDEDAWGDNSIYTYVLTKPGVTERSLNAEIQDITRLHSSETAKLFGEPMTRLYLYGTVKNGELVPDKLMTVRLLSVISAFILLIACINFINLSTARSEKRAREVGIRKVVGAFRKSLIAQFIGESTMIAAPVAWLLMSKWLLQYGYRISLGWQIFAASGLLALIIAAITVSFQSVKAAIRNPVRSLRAD
ncbi:MAG TPA: ABC transporter permease [Puia sp.]|nr:ABC transporter permease [Puia sp.]